MNFRTSVSRLALATILLGFSTPALATSFNVTGAAGGQSLSGSETGTVSSSGSITASTSGVGFTGSNNTLTDAGSISSSGSLFQSGLDFIGSNGNSVTITGTLTATAIGSTALLPATAYGIDLDNSNNNTITNSGTISATYTGTGGSATGIYVGGTGNTIILGATSHTDSIDVTGSGTKIIIGSGFTLGSYTGTAANVTVEYYTGAGPGALLLFPSEGGGFSTGGGTAITGYGSTPPSAAVLSVFGTQGTNYTLTALSTPATTGSAAPPRSVVVTSGTKHYAVTPDVFSNATQTLVDETTAQTEDIVNNRQRISLLGSGRESGMAAGNPYVLSNLQPWAQVFGSFQERPKIGDSAVSIARTGGVLGGVDLAALGSDMRGGLFLGGFAGSNKLGSNNFRAIRSQGVMLGGYVGRSFKGNYVSFQLQTGMAHEKSDRVVSGADAHATYDSWFVTPSVTVMRLVPRNGITLVPSFTVRYTEQYDGSYTETGSTANESVGSRTSGRLGARAQIAAREEDIAFSAGTLKPTWRIGLDGDTPVGGNHVNLNVLGSSVSLDPQSGTTLDVIAGLNLTFKMKHSGTQVYADLEGDGGLNNGGFHHNAGGTGLIGAKWRF